MFNLVTIFVKQQKAQICVRLFLKVFVFHIAKFGFLFHDYKEIMTNFVALIWTQQLLIEYRLRP